MHHLDALVVVLIVPQVVVAVHSRRKHPRTFLVLLRSRLLQLRLDTAHDRTVQLQNLLVRRFSLLHPPHNLVLRTSLEYASLRLRVLLRNDAAFSCLHPQHDLVGYRPCPLPHLLNAFTGLAHLADVLLEHLSLRRPRVRVNLA